MKKIASCLSLLAVCALSLIGCETAGPPPIDNAQYWQRVSASDMIYQQGPKAQQMLNRSIARCVTELREMERLGQIKNAIPTDFEGRVLDPDQKDLYDWDTPERDQQLFAEHSDYQDFESCMLDKGWERVKHVPYDVSARGERSYYATHVEYKDRFEDGVYKGYKAKDSKVTSNDQGPYGELND